jgi:hypothetical protein
MFAAVGHVSIDPNRIDEAEQLLREMVIPMVKQAPGFVSGIWTHSADGKGVGIVTFETEADARALVDQMRAMPAQDDGPVTMTSAEVYRVGATA